MKPENLVGKKYGLWTVISFKCALKSGTIWVCKCECGTEKPIYKGALVRGSSKSCGCRRSAITSKLKKTHGLTESPEYSAWMNMKYRCYNPKCTQYSDYGLRGIKICERWLNSFQSFFDDMGKRPFGLTLERKNNNGNYEPDNCEWATRSSQARNKRTTRFLSFRGETRSAADFADELGIPVGRIYQRKERGWSDEDALTIPRFKR